MNNSTNIIAPFDSVARQYDNEFDELWITQHLRARIWKESLEQFKPGASIVELNCGTGTDAIYFARNGLRVTAFDASSEMIAAAQKKSEQYHLPSSVISFYQRRTEDISSFIGEQYDGLFSNFGGLNCVPSLSSVIQSWKHLLKPGSYVILCFLNKFCLWEILSFLLRGNTTAAFRRFHNNGVSAQLGETSVHVWYYSPAEIVSILAPYFSIEKIWGINIFSPNSNSRFMIKEYPRLTRFLLHVDETLDALPPLCGMGDHFVIMAKLKP